MDMSEMVVTLHALSRPSLIVLGEWVKGGKVDDDALQILRGQAGGVASGWTMD